MKQVINLIFIEFGWALNKSKHHTNYLVHKTETHNEVMILTLIHYVPN